MLHWEGEMRICPNWMWCDTVERDKHYCGHATGHKTVQTCDVEHACGVVCLTVKEEEDGSSELRREED